MVLGAGLIVVSEVPALVVLGVSLWFLAGGGKGQRSRSRRQVQKQ